MVWLTILPYGSIIQEMPPFAQRKSEMRFSTARSGAKRRLDGSVPLLRHYEHTGMQLAILNSEAHNDAIAGRRQQLELLLEDYDNLIRLEPENRTAYLYRGAVNLDLGEHGAAFADFDAAVKLNPDDGLAYLKRAEAMFSLLMNDLRVAGMRDRRLERYINNLIKRMFSELNSFLTFTPSLL